MFKVKLLILLIAVIFLGQACNKTDKNDPIDKTAPIVLACDYFELDRTLKNDPDKQVDYIVTCLSAVNGKITIEPGTVIVFEDDAALRVFPGGSLKAVGTASDSIVFRSKTPLKGAWRGIFFESTSINNELSYCIIENAGGISFNSNGNRGAIIMWTGARAKINHCDIRNSETIGISMEYGGALVVLTNTRIRQSNSVPVIALASYIDIFDLSSDFSGNGNNRLQINGGEVGGKRMKKTNVPYYFNATVFPDKHISSQGVFTIDPGVEIEMGNNAVILIDDNGGFSSRGTESERIHIRGYDAIAGSWSGIYFKFTTNINNVMEHTVISNAGDGTDFGKGAVSLWANPRVTIRDCEFRSIPVCAVFSYNGASNPNLVLENNIMVNVNGIELCWN
jgi:hypothetical protein